MMKNYKFLNELNQSNQSNQSSPNNNSSIRDEKKTFELIHDMPNEIIWDEFLPTNNKKEGKG